MGVIDGVISVTPGWIDKYEVVEVEYDPARVAFADLVKKAETCECAIKVFTRTDEQQKTASKLVGDRAEKTAEKVRVDDDKYYLSKTHYKYVPMTPLQAAHVNARIGQKRDPSDLLSPMQQAVATGATRTTLSPQALPVAIGVDFRKAWKALRAKTGSK